MQLLDLSSGLWQVYPGAYGSVREEISTLMSAPVPPQEKLRRLDPEEKDGERVAFDNLCENLSHQGSFYPALYVALPYIARLFQQKAGDFSWQLAILTEAGMSLATDVPWNHSGEEYPEDILSGFQEAAALLAEGAKEFLARYPDQLKQLAAYRREGFYTGLTALLGDRKAAYVLMMNYWQTCYLQCRKCGNPDEDLELGDREQLKKLKPARTWLQKWDRRSYGGVLLQLDGVMKRLGDRESRKKLALYRGSYTCPRCGARGCVMDWSIAGWQEELPEPQKPAGNRTEAPSKTGREQPVPLQVREPSEVVQQDNILRPAEVDRLCREAYPQVFALIDQGQPKQGADLCRELLKQDSSDWRLYILRAFCCKGNTVEVDKALTAALAMEPDNVLLLRARCSGLGTKKRFLRHIEDLTRLLELDPDCACLYWSNRAYYYHWTDSDDDARRDLESILAHPGREEVIRSADFNYLYQILFPAAGQPEGREENRPAGRS